MLRLVLAASILCPSLSHATSLLRGSSVTGTIEVSYPRCVDASCRPIVHLRAGDEIWEVTGEYFRDLEAFHRKTVTVQGRKDTGNGERKLDVVGFAPGRSREFVTGVVRDTSGCDRTIPSHCHYSVEIQTSWGMPIKVLDPALAQELSQLDGATVTVRGTVARPRCPPGARCMGGGPLELVPTAGSNLSVKGVLKTLLHTTEVREPGFENATHGLALPNGAFVPVYAKYRWTDRIDSTVWLTGRFDGRKLHVTRASKSIKPDELPIDLGSGSPADGANVARGADTDGAAEIPGTEDGQGAGLRR